MPLIEVKLYEGRLNEETAPVLIEKFTNVLVEVYGEGAAATARSHAALAERVETSGETVFFYLRDARALLRVLSQEPSVRYLHRPANLEDLFLKLTGRQIRDDA